MTDPIDDIRPTTTRGGRNGLLALLVAVFLLGGIAAGMGIERYLVLPRQMHAHGGGWWAHGGRAGLGRDGGFARDRRDAMRERLRHDLNLSDVQVHQVDSIMGAQESAVTALQREMRPRFETLMAATHAKIDSVLTPQQRAIHDAHRPPPPRTGESGEPGPPRP